MTKYAVVATARKLHVREMKTSIFHQNPIARKYLNLNSYNWKPEVNFALFLKLV